MATITIDGKQIEADAGQMLIEAADAAGISIPRFCYHKKLSVAANCRMCLVDVEKAPKPLPACATPIADGMVVKTQSDRARDAQKAVMEFLLINHPLDCPICDQGGECELQDLAMGYGKDISRFSEGKRVVEDKDLGPFIATEMTRCIHCTRCVRFGEEVSGNRELGATGRGEHTSIGTFLVQNVESNISANVIDLCPVGALTAKPSRFTARAWELEQRKTIAAHDGYGSNINVHTRRGQIIRTAPNENEQINEVWLSDRDRFSYEAYQHKDRLRTPMIKENGRWTPVSWEKALQRAVDLTKDIMLEHGADQWGMLLSPNTTLEEGALAQKLARRFHCHNVDYRIDQQDFKADALMPVVSTLGFNVSSLSEKDCVVILGSNIADDLPLLTIRLRQAQKNGQHLILINVKEFETYIPGVIHIVDASFAQGLSRAQACPELSRAKNIAYLIGPQAIAHPEFAHLYQAVEAAVVAQDATMGLITRGANAAGLNIAGCLPHQSGCGVPVENPGLNAQQMIDASLKVYWLQGIEADDFIDASAAQRAFENAKGVVCLTPFRSEALESVADVMLPMALPYENTGTFVNNQGQWQSFEAAVSPLAEAKPAWKIYRVLANFFGLDGFDIQRRQDVTLPLKNLFESGVRQPLGSIPKIEHQAFLGLRWAGELVEYAVDGVCRRASALQKATSMARTEKLYIHPDIAQRFELKDGMSAIISLKDNSSQHWTRQVVVDNSIAPGIVWLPLNGQTLQMPYAEVELRSTC